MTNAKENYQPFFENLIRGGVVNEIICNDFGKPCDFRFFKRVIDSSKEAISISDSDGKYIYINQAHEQLFGYCLEDAVTLNYRDCYPPESIEVIDGIITPALIRGIGWEGELDVLDKNGRRFPLWERADPMLDENGRFLYAFRLMHDVSRWQKAQRDLFISESHLKQAQNLANIGSFRYNISSNIYQYSEQLQVILFNKKDFLEQLQIENLENSILPDDLPLWNNAIKKVISSNQAVEVSFRIRRPDFSLRHVLAILSPLSNSTDVVQEIVGTIQDVTEHKRKEEERKSFEQQLQQLQKLESLGVLAGGIAHDFNNLLMTILGNTDLALSHLPHQSPAHKHLQEIDRATQHAAKLTKQMLAYSGKGKIFIELININELVTGVSELLASSISKKIVLKFNIEPDTYLINADASQLRQLLLNLVINASESIGNISGSITIKTGKKFLSPTVSDSSFVYVPPDEGTYAFIQVEDTGCGIDNELLAKIFDPFFTTKFTGRGLGLAAVLGIVRSHNGAINITTDKNKGSVFTIFFPLVSAKDRVSAVDSSISPSLTTESTILVVDDDIGVRTVAAEMLQLLGYQVLKAEDGIQAIEILKLNTKTISAVILDYSMPHLNGEETFRELLQLSPSLKVFLSSGFSEREATEKFQASELAGFLHKPYKLSELKETFSKVFSS